MESYPRKYLYFCKNEGFEIFILLQQKLLSVVWHIIVNSGLPAKKLLISIKDWQKELSIIIEFHQC